MTTSADRVAGDSFTGVVLGGRYRLDGLIGRGGMASVYRGEDLSLGRSVAVKVFAENAEGIDDAERRKSETALFASVSHRALVRLYDAARDPASGREFLVMELIDGRDLRETLRLGPLSPTDAAAVLADLAEALHVIHERGIVHRDVKPANVLLEPSHVPTRTWNAKLADFGIARLVDDARITSTGLLVGTPGYLAPEQVTGTPPTPAADIYALGLVVLEARTGETAFPGPAVEAASARLARDPEIPASLGDDWVALLRTMTAREPADRPSAIDVAGAAAGLDETPMPPMTAPTVAYSDVAEIPTAAVADPGGAEESPATGDPIADSDTIVPTASPRPTQQTSATRVLPAPDRSFFGPPVAAPDAPAPGSRAERERERARRVRPQSAPGGTASRRGARLAIVIGLLAVLAAAVVWVISAALMGPDTTAELEPMPNVPGQLGVHLEELEQAVTG
ncbi:serine/threonine-protein kinase [Agromyces sp. Marseille-P2726]|uniref:serine/threonine-protein kinase n=1 Tax=Agromyces sp. Marseille-P2726 TaxID=2709132 RepID=UPI00156E3080|nr:serine/threonine-protein kinase [Agromyces sp. Marseille-P2726]